MKILLKISCTLSLLLVSASACAYDNKKDKISLTLLGTGGGPGGNIKRAGISSLLKVNGTSYLIDAGDNLTRQLARSGVNEASIPYIFLTHLHDDHTAGLPAFLTFAHTLRSKGSEIFGPPRTTMLIKGILSYMAVNSEIRRAERHLKDPKEIFKGQDVKTGLIFNDHNIKVTATENTHFHLNKNNLAVRNKSYSYRFDIKGKVIVFTGDTGPSQAVEKMAKNADILVSEMVSKQDIAHIPLDVAKHMITEHLSAENVGKLAHAAKVKMLILSHIRTVSDIDLQTIKKYYSGKIVVGQDLDQFKM